MQTKKINDAYVLENPAAPTIDYHNGNGVANTCEIAYVKAYQA